MPLDLRSLARSYTTMAIQQLSSIARDSDNDGARVAACGMLLDRGWGKVVQPVTGSDGGDIRITIRNIIEARTIDNEPVVIEDDAPRMKLVNGGGHDQSR